jgi:hypothetical protein
MATYITNLELSTGWILNLEENFKPRLRRLPGSNIFLPHPESSAKSGYGSDRISSIASSAPFVLTAGSALMYRLAANARCFRNADKTPDLRGPLEPEQDRASPAPDRELCNLTFCPYLYLPGRFITTCAFGRFFGTRISPLGLNPDIAAATQHPVSASPQSQCAPGCWRHSHRMPASV